MNIISWNCRGLGNLHAIPNLKDLIRSHKPGVLFLCETLVQASKIEEIWVKVGFNYAFAADREGRSDGLAVLWKSQVQCTILNYCRNFINLEVTDNVRGTWRLTGFHGYPGRDRRKESWNLLLNLEGMSRLPWCIIGDFNDILSQQDKDGRVEHPSWFYDGFRNTVLQCNLIDLELQGYPFTWSRSKGKVDAVEERLDRAMVTEEWLDIFPNATLHNAIATISDHSPIVLNREVQNWIPRKHRFMFENNWLIEPEIEEVVTQGWLNGNHDSVLSKLEGCVDELRKWSMGLRKKFKDDIEHYKKQLERLREYNDAASVEEYNSVKKRLSHLLAQQEKFWKQRPCQDST